MENELQKSFPERMIIDVHSPETLKMFSNFQQVMMMYNCAIKEVRTKFEVLNDELSTMNNRNPIEMIKSRVKKPDSIVNKLMRRGYPLNIVSVLENLNDVAGVRVICSFVDDIYKIASMFSAQDDVTVLEVKDYIKHPKENGYRSYHMIVEVPVFFSNEKQNIKVEVQLRTIAMDFWASLEHTMKYKKNVENPDAIAMELKECADLITKADFKMQEINNRINKSVS
ncbi:MAG: GTP pyrophosphokinase family protein [Clostridia bacterium]|nr:GTP pyrophosphokinase family protein [Clostridia bacterium]